MAREISDRAKLFRTAFTKAEWEYLRSIEEFATEADKPHMTVDDFVRATKLGHELLLKRESDQFRPSPR